METIKLVAVGDGCAGKTALMWRFAKKGFFDRDFPTTLDNFSTSVIFKGKHVLVNMHDTGDYDGLQRLRPTVYPKTDVVLVCFDTSRLDPFDNIKEIWLPELNHHLPGVPKLLVGCQCDIQTVQRAHDPRIPVSQADIDKFSEKVAMKYVKTSALLNIGVDECLDTAIEMGLKFRWKIGYPPEHPKIESFKVNVETSKFSEHWQNALHSEIHSDVVFLANGSELFKAHKIVLCSASTIFENIFGIADSVKDNNQLKTVGHETSLTHSEWNQILQVKTENDKPESCHLLEIELSENIETEAFKRLISYIYTGKIESLSDVTDKEINDVLTLSEIFQMSELQELCKIIKRDVASAEAMHETSHFNTMCTKMNNIFLNKPLFADVVFIVEFKKIFGHKVILAARSEVMAAMFNGNFAEGGRDMTEINIPDTSAENFIVLLEYLYTDNIPTDTKDAMGVIVLADQYLLSRLKNLCELHIINKVHRQNQMQLESSDYDVIDLLHQAQQYNAKQLSSWCLHFISMHYDSFKKLPEFQQLTCDNLMYVEQNKWPPESYLNELAEYEEFCRKKKKKSHVDYKRKFWRI